MTTILIERIDIGIPINKTQTKWNVWMRGTWNVRSSNKKENELNCKSTKFKLSILLISGTKEKDQKIIDLTGDHTLIYSGISLNTQAVLRVASIVYRNLKQNIQHWGGDSQIRSYQFTLKIKPTRYNIYSSIWLKRIWFQKYKNQFDTI